MEDISFSKKILRLGLPIVMQQFLGSAINLLDNFMVGRLGGAEITAVGLANQVFMIYTVLLFGISSGGMIFIAQFWGENRDEAGIHKTVSLMLTCSLAAAVLFAGLALFFPRALMSVYSADPAVIEIGAGYLTRVAPSYVFTAVAYCFSMGLRAVGQPRPALFTTVIALLVNAGLNAVLIFGLLGFPALGTNGAAIATSVARAVEITVLAALVYAKKMPVAAPLRGLLRFGRAFAAKFFRTAGFVILVELSWSVGNSLYNAAYKYAGTPAQTAVQISGVVFNLFIVLSYGMGNACAVILGHELGAGRRDTALRYARKVLGLTGILGVALGLVLALVIPLLPGLFKVTPLEAELTRQVLWVTAIMMPIRCVEYAIMVGILRSGGDTKFSLLMDIVAVWAIGVPLAFLSVRVFGFPIWACVLLVHAEMLFKCVVCGVRALSGKWMNKVT